MDEELDSLTENCAFTRTELPRGAKPVKSRWIYKLKKNSDGTTRYKARLVAKGFTQRYGVDYLETFAPVVKYKSLRMMLALANEKSWIVHQMHVTTAFLYGEIDREIYMIPPDGVDLAKDGRKVWRLDRSLYGLKQSPRCWNRRIHDFLVTHLLFRAFLPAGNGISFQVLFLFKESSSSLIPPSHSLANGLWSACL